MEQIWGSRNKPLYLWPINFWQKQFDRNEEFSTNDAGTTEYPHAKWTKRLAIPFTLYSEIDSKSETLM